MSYNYLPLDRKPLNFQQVKNLLDYQQLVSITFDAHEKILQCRQYLDNKLDSGNELYYGINTGLGYLQEVQIDKSQMAELQYNLLKSHACGLGEEVPFDIVKLRLMPEVIIVFFLPLFRSSHSHLVAPLSAINCTLIIIRSLVTRKWAKFYPNLFQNF